MIKGLDISNHQSTFPTSGFDFVIVKATEGRTYVDPRQGQHAARARTAGLVVGFYHFLWPGNAEQQAAWFTSQCASLPGDILACDWEYTGSGTRASTADKDAFLREVKRLRPDHRVLLYCNTDFWLHRDTSDFAADGLWIAHYGVPAGQPGIRDPWLIHQYTSSPLDTNVAQFTSRAAMRAWATGDQETDMAVTDADVKKIWTTDGIVANGNPATKEANPFVTPGWSLFALETVARRTEGKVDALASVELTDEQVAAIAAALAAHPALADVLAEKVAAKLADRLAD